MGILKVNTIRTFSGTNITLGGHAIPSGSDKNLGSETNPWSKLYVSTGSVNFVSTNNATIASIKAIGESGVAGNTIGQIFTDTGNNNLRGSFSVGKNNRASGTASLAVGFVSTASGDYSSAHGFGARALGYSSFAQGNGSVASGSFSFAQGWGTMAPGNQSHAEGDGTTASGVASHTEGGGSIASGNSSHAEGYATRATDLGAHAEGQYTWASGAFAHTEGAQTTASGFYSHAEGYQTRTDADAWVSHAEGFLTIASGWGSHAEGSGSVTQGRCSHAAGNNTLANGNFQSVIGQFNVANASQSAFIIGDGTADNARHNVLFVSKSHFEVSASRTFLQGLPNTAQTNVLTYNAATGQVYYTSSINVVGTAIPVDIQEDGTPVVSNPTFINFTGPGVSTSVNGSGIDIFVSGGGAGTGLPAPSDTYIQYNSGSTFGAEQHFRYIYTSHSLQQGNAAVASGDYSHAEGSKTTAQGDYSHAEGDGSISLGLYSHAEGKDTITLGTASHAGGRNTIASASYQTVFGQYNTLNNTSSFFIVGAGTSGNRKDGFSVELDTANVRPHIVLPTNTSNPDNPKVGSMYFNPSTNTMYIYNGTAWKSAVFS